MNKWYIEVINEQGHVVHKKIFIAKKSADAIKVAQKVYGDEFNYKSQVVRNYD